MVPFKVVSKTSTGAYSVDMQGGKVPLVIPKKILVFAPHPDDELISCGGTILKYHALGSKIIVVLMSPGLGGYTKQEEVSKIAAVRKEEYRHAMESLHVDEVIDLKMEEVVVNRESIKLVTNLIRDHQPDVIFAPHVSDTHRAHRATAEIAKESVYHAVHGKAYGGHEKNVLPKGFYCYESPSCNYFYVDASVICVCDISAQWEHKVDTFNKVYASQSDMLARIMKWAEKTARLHGEEIFCEYAEAFIPDTEYVPLQILIL